jgi:transcriptional regulator with XRE-family HTH domain
MAEPYNYRSPRVNYFSCFTDQNRSCIVQTMNIGSRLHLARTEAGFTQAQLAEATGISQQMISKIERGASAGTTVLVPLALACRVRPEWLYTGEGDKAQTDDDQVQSVSEVRELASVYLQASSTQRQSLLTIARSFKASKNDPDEESDD